jgi:capsular polysaccharide biosynthesis protein
MLMRLMRRWWLVGGLTVVGALVGLGYGLLRPPVYSAKAYVVVVAQNSGDGTAVSYAQAYARIAGQGDVLAAASGSNGTTSPAELRRAVRASSSPDAPIVEITGSGRSASHAADLANLVAAGLISTANRATSDTRVKLVLLSTATAPASPASPRPALDVAVGAAAGLLLGGLVLLSSPGRREEIGGRREGTDGQRWIGTATALPARGPVAADRHEASTLYGPNLGDGPGSAKGGAAGSDGAGRNGSRRSPAQRTAKRNAARRRRTG